MRSLDPMASVTGVMRLGAYAALFWIALVVGRDAARAHTLLWTLAGAAGLYSAYGLVVFWSGNQTILWHEKWAYGDALTSTFVNRNSLAAWAGLGAVAALALVWEEIVRATGIERGLFRIVGQLRGRAFLSIVVLLVMGAALLFSHSRGGLLATMVGVAVLVLALAVNGRGRLRSIAKFGAVVLLAGGALFVASGQGTASRIHEPDITGSGRLNLWRVTV